MKHLIDILQLSTQEIDELVAKANDIIAHPDAYAHKCDGKILATLFFEPSTRTRLSFESAMLSLGGKVLGFSSASSSSASKGESVSDTIRTVSCYSDIIAMRHPKEGAPLVASMRSEVPVINAGDGGHNHPTQTLTDLLTIQREKGRFNDLTVGFCGDLKFGRTVHSLISALSRYTGIKIVLISPEELKLPSYVKNEALKKNNIPYEQTTDLEAVMPQLDILYMTRVQRERFFNEEDYLRLKELSDTANGELTGRAKITFERYAQGRFFRQIVARANQRLYQMTNGRFELAMQESAQNNRGKTGLDLDVIDHYTGKRRSVKTLSGGEAFQASLSLALGLSDVVQRRSGGMQLDALFLDEGFGTLDEETLNTAMKALFEIQKSGRTVGIISHVAELKSRIPALRLPSTASPA